MVKETELGMDKDFMINILKAEGAIKIALSYSKQIVKSIPVTDEDIKMDWINYRKRRYKNIIG